VRAAYNLYTAAGSPWPAAIPDPVTVKAIFEIAPTDFGSGAPAGSWSALGLTWNVLLPMCDGDVSNLQGVRPFDRAILNLENPPIQKSTFTVWGANHNFFNTEWQLSDGNLNLRLGGMPPYTPICAGMGNAPIFTPSPGSGFQQVVAMSSVLALFRGNVGTGADVTFNQIFNPPFGIPANVTCSVLTLLPPCNGAANVVAYPTRTDRGYSPPGSFLVFQDFTIPPPAGTSIDRSNVDAASTHVPNHDPSLMALAITWPKAGAAGEGTYLQTNWTPANKPGRDITAYQTLDLRVSRVNDPAGNPVVTTDFSIRLVGANGVMTRPLLLSAYTDPNFAGAAGNQSTLSGPVGATAGKGGLHPILQTVRIPLTDFGNFAAVGPQVRGVRLIFDQTATGSIYLANIRISKEIGSGAVGYPNVAAAPGPATRAELTAPPSPIVHPLVHPARLSLRHLDSIWELDGASGWEITISSNWIFPPQDERAVLRIGPYTFDVGHDPLNLNQRVFSLTEGQFKRLSSGMKVTVQYGLGEAIEYWDCGKLP